MSEEMSMKQQVVRFLDRNSAQAYDVIAGALVETIQPELDRLGSSMNAGNVVLEAIQDQFKVRNLEQIRSQMIEAGIPEDDQLIVDVDARIANLS